MAEYKVNTPDGRVMILDGPEGASEQEILQAASTQYYNDPSNIKRDYTFGQLAGKAFTRGAKRLGSTFGDTIPAMIGSGLGFENYAKRQLQEAEQTEREIATSAAPQFPSFKDVKGVGDAAKFVTETIFEQIPNFGTIFLGGGAGSQAAKIGAKKLSNQYVGKELTKKLAQRQAKGQAAGVLLGSYALNAPEVFQNIYQETGELATGVSLLFGAGAAALDSALPGSILKKLTPYEKLAVTKEVLKKSGTDQTLLNKVFRGLTRGAITEGLTEGAQEAISISAEKFVGNNPQIFDSEDFDRILESSVRGAVAGGGLSAVAAPFTGTKPETPTEKPTEKTKPKVMSDQEEIIPQEQPSMTPVTDPEPTDPEPTDPEPTQLGLPGIPDEPAGPVQSPLEKGEALEQLINDNPNIEYDPVSDQAYILTRDTSGKPVALEAKWKWNNNSNKWVPQKLTSKSPIGFLPTVTKTGKTKAFPAKQPTLPFDSLPSPKTPGLGGTETQIKGANTFLAIAEKAAQAKNFEYNELNNTAYDPKTKKSYEWNPKLLKWQESENVNETKSGTDTTLGISPSVSEQPSTTASERTESLDDRGVGETRDDVRDADRGTTKRDDSIEVTPSSATLESIEITPTLQNNNPLYESTDQLLQELYEEFGKPLIDRFMGRNKLILVNDVQDVAEYGIDPNEVKTSLGFFIRPTSNITKTRFFDQKRAGRSFLIVNRNRRGTARNILLHEIGEHYGLQSMLGDAYAPTLLQLERLKNTDPLVAKAWESVTQRYARQGLKYGTETAMEFLSEVAAMIGETAPENTWFRRVMGAVKQFLRRLGFYDPKKITSRDLQEMILYSLNRSLREPAKSFVPPGAGEYTIKNSISDELFSEDNPPGGYNPKNNRKIMDMAEKAIRETPRATGKAIERARRVINELPVGLKELAMGLAGMPVLSQIYGKYLPSIRTLMNLIEKRAGAADRQRAIADELAHIGLDAHKGKERKKVKFINSKTREEIPIEKLYDGSFTTANDIELVTVDNTSETQKYSDSLLREWNRIVYELSRGEDGGMYELGINPTFKDHANHPEVVKFKKLPKELQMITLGYVSYYNAQAKKYNEAIINALPGDSRTGAERREALKNKLIESQLVFYIPFKRKGDYVLRYTRPGGVSGRDYVSERFRYQRERDQRIRELQSDPTGNITDISTDFDPDIRRGSNNSSTTSFFNDVLNELKSRMATDSTGRIIDKKDQALLDNVYGIYLDMFPSADIIQMMRRREGIYGETQDVVNGFADTSAKLANHIVNLEYRPQFDQQFSNLNQEATKAIVETLPQDSTLQPEEKDKLEQSLRYAVGDITKKGSSFIYNPVADPLHANLAYVSFWSTIAGNASSAIVNFTQLAIVVYPMLIGRYGFQKGNAAFFKAFKVYLSGGFDNNRRFAPDKSFGMMNGHLRSQANADAGLIEQKDVLPEDLIKLYDYGVDNSVFKRGLGYELTELREKTADDYTGIKTKVDATLGWMFQNTERANREITFMAGYFAEKETNPNKSFEAIAEISQDLTRESHGTSLPDVGPRYFQSGWGKTIFTFKRFAHSMMALTLRLFHDTTKAGDARRGELAEQIAKTSNEVEIKKMEAEITNLALEKTIARKQLAGIYGMSFVFAGMQGMPLYGAMEAFTEAMYAMFGDEDEPFDFNEGTRNIFGDIGYKGPMNKLLNVDIASRTGFANLFWRDDPRRIQEIGVLGYTMESLLGPSYSYANSFRRGVESMSDGYVYRGLEQMTPAFLRNPLKSFRYMNEGARTRNGAKLTELNGLDAFMQVFGFTNEDLSKAYEQNTAMKNAERNMLHRRSGLLTAAFVAQENGDTELYNEVLKKINKFNQSSTGKLNPITGKTLTVSYKQRKRAMEESVNGITLTKKYRDYLQQQFNN